MRCENSLSDGQSVRDTRKCKPRNNPKKISDSGGKTEISHYKNMFVITLIND